MAEAIRHHQGKLLQPLVREGGQCVLRISDEIVEGEEVLILVILVTKIISKLHRHEPVLEGLSS